MNVNRLHFKNRNQVTKAVGLLILAGHLVSIVCYNFLYFGTRWRGGEVLPYTIGEHVSGTLGAYMMGFITGIVTFPLAFFRLFGLIVIHDVSDPNPPSSIVSENVAMVAFWVFVVMNLVATYKLKSKVLFGILTIFWLLASVRWLECTIAILASV